MSCSETTIRPPTREEISRRVLRDVVDGCADALTRNEASLEIRDRVRVALKLEGCPAAGDPLTAQLRAIEFEADRIDVYGIERLRSRLAYARALLELPLQWWR